MKERPTCSDGRRTCAASGTLGDVGDANDAKESTRTLPENGLGAGGSTDGESGDVGPSGTRNLFVWIASGVWVFVASSLDGKTRTGSASSPLAGFGARLAERCSCASLDPPSRRARPSSQRPPHTESTSSTAGLRAPSNSLDSSTKAEVNAGSVWREVRTTPVESLRPESPCAGLGVRANVGGKGGSHGGMCGRLSLSTAASSSDDSASVSGAPLRTWEGNLGTSLAMLRVALSRSSPA